MANPKSKTKAKRDAKGHFVSTEKKSKEKELRDQVARLQALLSVEEKRSGQTAKDLESVSIPTKFANAEVLAKDLNCSFIPPK